LIPDKGYVWFLLDWLESDWWNVDFYNSPSYTAPENVPCTTAELKFFIEQGYFTLSSPFFGDEDQSVEGGGNVKEWKDRYKARVTKEVTLNYCFFSSRSFSCHQKSLVETILANVGWQMLFQPTLKHLPHYKICVLRGRLHGEFQLGLKLRSAHRAEIFLRLHGEFQPGLNV